MFDNIFFVTFVATMKIYGCLHLRVKRQTIIIVVRILTVLYTFMSIFIL